MKETHTTARQKGFDDPLSQVNVSKRLDQHLSSLKKQFCYYEKSLKDFSIKSNLSIFSNSEEAVKFGFNASFDDMIELWRLYSETGNRFNSTITELKKHANKIIRLATELQFCREAVETFEDKLEGSLSDIQRSVI